LRDDPAPAAGTPAKRTVKDAPSAGNGGKAAKTGVEDKPLRGGRVSNAKDELQGSEEIGTKKRGRSAAWQAEEQQEIEAPAKIAKPGRRGRSSNVEVYVHEVVEKAVTDQRGNPSGGSAEKQSNIEEPAEGKTRGKKPGLSAAADVEEENRGRRRTRRSDVDTGEHPPATSAKEEKKRKRGRHSREVIGVETASSTFGKARGRPAKPPTAEPAPGLSKSKKHGEQSSSGPSKKSGSATTKVSGKKASRSSNPKPLERERKKVESEDTFQ